MNREFVLRDNEVAINRPDGTVIIMNLNALRELKGDSNKDKEIEALRQELAEAKHAAEAWKNRHELMSEKVNDLKAETEMLRNELEMQHIELEVVLKEKNEFDSENARLTREVCSKNAEILKLQQKLDQYSKQHVVLFGPTESPLPSAPAMMPDHVYIAHTGEVFFSQRDVEKAYNLAKGSVSAYFNDKQTALYARDPWGNRITDKGTGKEVTIGVVRRYANQIFKNRDINRPVFENYELAIKCAKDFVK